MSRKSKSNGTKKILLIVLILLIILSVFGIYNKLTGNGKKTKIEEIKKEDEIKEFDYTLYDNKSDLYKDLFAELKKELQKDEINDEEYAKIISKLFVADFYSLDEKTTSTDIGGLDFIYEKIRDNFLLKASDTIYKNIELSPKNYIKDKYIIHIPCK